MNLLKIKKINRPTRINKIEISVLIGLLSAILLCFLNCFSTSNDISKNVLRLHILANSNSSKDQNLKLKVRDEILKNFNFNNLDENLDKAKFELKKNLPAIEKVAKKTINQEGFSYNVKAKLEKTYFNTRKYENFAMPAGVYDALRIEIGDAKGENWWCVMVPSMCVPAANKKEEIFESFTENEKDLLKKGDKTELRFFTIELFNKIFHH